MPEEELQRTKTPTCQHHSSPQPDYLDYLTADEPEAVAERVFVVFLRVFVTEIDSDSGRFGGGNRANSNLKKQNFHFVPTGHRRRKVCVLRDFIYFRSTRDRVFATGTDTFPPLH